MYSSLFYTLFLFLFSLKLIPGCDVDGPALCVDISDAVSLGLLQDISSGNTTNPFSIYTAQELETRGILQGNLFINICLLYTSDAADE